MRGSAALGVARLGEHALEVGAVDHRAIAPELVGGVNGPDRGAHEDAELVAVLGVAGDAERDGQGQGVGREGAPRRSAQALGDQEGALLVGLGEDHAELLAAQAAGGVDPALPLRHVVRELLERGVAGGVAALGVEAAEPVDLTDDQRHRPAGAPRPVELEIEHLLEGAAVEQTRERVDATRLGQAEAERGDLPPLMDDHDE